MFISLALKIALAVVLVSKILLVFRILVWRPHVLTKSFKKQGVTGPPYSLLRGSLDEVKELKKAAWDIILDTNSNDIFKRVLQHYLLYTVLRIWRDVSVLAWNRTPSLHFRPRAGQANTIKQVWFLQ
ncbi:hypothetical protein CRYUN_Cryun23aG0116800 [Craigia yunnanensis]